MAVILVYNASGLRELYKFSFQFPRNLVRRLIGIYYYTKSTLRVMSGERGGFSGRCCITLWRVKDKCAVCVCYARHTALELMMEACGPGPSWVIVA